MSMHLCCSFVLVVTVFSVVSACGGSGDGFVREAERHERAGRYQSAVLDYTVAYEGGALNTSEFLNCMADIAEELGDDEFCSTIPEAEEMLRDRFVEAFGRGAWLVASQAGESHRGLREIRVMLCH